MGSASVFIDLDEVVHPEVGEFGLLPLFELTERSGRLAARLPLGEIGFFFLDLFLLGQLCLPSGERNSSLLSKEVVVTAEAVSSRGVVGTCLAFSIIFIILASDASFSACFFSW